MNIRFVLGLAALLWLAGCDDEPAGRACTENATCRVNELCLGGLCGPIPPLDGDGDGVPDAVEALAGTDPALADTDGDGADDRAELGWTVGTRLYAGDDSDGDGVIDALDSSLADADGDGVVDQDDPCNEDPQCPNAGPDPCEALEGESCVIGVGACAELGVTVCTDDGLDVTCAGEVGAPMGEMCTGVDDDCDGQTDEGFDGLGTPCEAGVGGCRVEGTRACTDDGRGVACTAVADEPSDERCNGEDDDCDGEIDEDFPDLGFVCDVGLGECAARGIFECSPGGLGVQCGAEAPAPVPERCNRLDDDCDGRIDETFARVGQACEVGLGGCTGFGAWRCNDAEDDVECDAEPGAPGDEVCDDVDNDCDGRTDETFPELGTPCVGGVGACQRPGEQVCAPDGAGYVCGIDAIEGSPERCNTLDDDCDGEVDEGIEGLGEPCADGIGVCRVEGVIACDRLNEEAVCTARATPGREEICNDLDDDCDGVTDEGFPTLGDPCAAGVGACRVQGRIVCAADPREVVCDAAERVGQLERCNDRDDDCDGEIDEEYGLGEPCTAGQGLCAADGVRICGPDGDAVCQAAVGDPVDETCDGRDEDCDGRVDEVFPVGQPCAVGFGACIRDGQQVCTEDGADTRCDAEPGDPSPEVCNGEDDDCDGPSDEDFPGLGERCEEGLGECTASGRRRCAPDEQTLICDAEPDPPAPAEVCDRRDDDCDGEVDEDFPELDTPCSAGIGACRDEGVFTCRRGEASCTAVAGDPRPEVCDEVDDDCDGAVDEDYGPDCARRLLDVSAGGYHTCGRRPDGTVLCWGQIDPPAPGAFTSLAAGGDWHCALDEVGEPACWGDGPPAQFEVPAGPFDQLALGSTHGCGLTAGGQPRCWGVDQSGETVPPPGVVFTALAAGPALTCGIDDERALHCWGANDNRRAEPPEGAFIEVTLGSEHGCGLRDDGTIACWGAAGLDRLVAPDGPFRVIDAGDFHTCAVDAEGAVSCWGAGGEGRPEQFPHFGQSAVPELPPIMDVAAGGLHTCGRTADDGVICWGAGDPDDPDDGFFQVGQSTVP